MVIIIIIINIIIIFNNNNDNNFLFIFSFFFSIQVHKYLQNQYNDRYESAVERVSPKSFLPSLSLFVFLCLSHFPPSFSFNNTSFLNKTLSPSPSLF